MKIYGESLRPDVPYKTLLLSTFDTTAYVVKETLEKYGLEKEDPTKYCLVQVCTFIPSQVYCPVQVCTFISSQVYCPVLVCTFIPSQIYCPVQVCTFIPSQIYCLVQVCTFMPSQVYCLVKVRKIYYLKYIAW